MKKFLYTIGLSLSLTAFANVTATNKIAVVDISKIFQQIPQRATAATQLEKEFKSRATELQDQENELKTKIQHLNRDSATMKASERSRIEKDIMSQRETFSTKAQAFDQDNRRRQLEERNKILDRIHKAVENVANRDGYDIVIDTNSVAYAINARDITTNVLQQVK